jgi:preprotein translocase subunit SecA
LKLDDIREKAGGKKEDAEARTKIIVYLMALAEKEYESLEKRILEISGNPNVIREVERGIILRAIDMLWVEHLEAIDNLKTGIGLRGYGQRDPLIEYKKEAYRMFNELLELIDKQIVYSIFKVGVTQTPAKSLLERRGISVVAPSKGGERGENVAAGFSTVGENVAAGFSPRKSAKVGRNDPCPCGSGKKYKKCHGA